MVFLILKLGMISSQSNRMYRTHASIANKFKSNDFTW